MISYFLGLISHKIKFLGLLLLLHRFNERINADILTGYSSYLLCFDIRKDFIVFELSIKLFFRRNNLDVDLSLAGGIWIHALNYFVVDIFMNVYDMPLLTTLYEEIIIVFFKYSFDFIIRSLLDMCPDFFINCNFLTCPLSWCQCEPVPLCLLLHLFVHTAEHVAGSRRHSPVGHGRPPFRHPASVVPQGTYRIIFLQSHTRWIFLVCEPDTFSFGCR